MIQIKDFIVAEAPGTARPQPLLPLCCAPLAFSIARQQHRVYPDRVGQCLRATDVIALAALPLGGAEHVEYFEFNQQKFYPPGKVRIQHDHWAAGIHAQQFRTAAPPPGSAHQAAD